MTLFSNIGYVLVILITLAALGIQWSNLAWIVSALSVGIGFGLQEIVKNFISGLILLTERPVKVGDMIGIGGVEGDAAHQRARHRNPAQRPFHHDRTELAADLAERAQRHHGQRAR